MSKNVLIIESEIEIQELLSSSIQSLEYSTLVAESVEEGWKSFEEHHPPVSVIDLHSLENGMEFLKKMEKESMDQYQFIVITDPSQEEEVRLCYEMGIQSFLRKPIHLPELKGAVELNMEWFQQNKELLILQQRTGHILQRIPELIWECDSNFQLTFLSPNVEKILGFAPDELIGLPIPDLLVPEDVVQFFYKFEEKIKKTEEEIQAITLRFRSKDEEEVSMQVTAHGIMDENGAFVGIIGSARDVRANHELTQSIEKATENLLLHVNAKGEIVYVSEKALEYFPAGVQEKIGNVNLAEYATDPSTLSLLEFSFDQQEDLPFPIELRLENEKGDSQFFSVNFEYEKDLVVLVGKLLPVGANLQASMLSKTIETQEKQLLNTVAVDPEMAQGILIDSQNLASETVALIKQLEEYAYPAESELHLSEFEQFVANKSMSEYTEELRLLGNKVHGLKGTSGFLLPASKQLCHHMEEITRPLAQHQLVLTLSLSKLLKEFIFKVQEMLEEYQNTPEVTFDVSDWMTKIDQALEIAQEYIAGKQEQFVKLIEKQSTLNQEVKKTKVEEYLSVSLYGFESLSDQVQNLFYTFAEQLIDDQKIKASNLYNDFINTHQQIKKIPVDMNRYERLVPSLGKDYHKEVEFVYKDHGIRADREFWNSMHEIFNHVLKNAVIHGIETPQERLDAGKEKEGKVSVEIQEDALNIFVSIVDDGRGLDIQKIKEKAIENGMVSAEKIHLMSEEEILNMVFLPGVSTVDSLDDNAGRGVGMNAVQEAMKQFNGECKIISDVGKSSGWHFSFPKSNVSLACFIITIGDSYFAIPENHVHAFQRYQSEYIVTINQNLVYRHRESTIPLIFPEKVFDSHVSLHQKNLLRLLILKQNDEAQKVGLVINDIVHHSTLPIIPLPEEYRNLPVYIGATFLSNEPVLVLNTQNLSP